MGERGRWHPIKWFNPAPFTPTAHRVFPFRLSWKCIKTKSVLSLKYSEAEPKSSLGLARGSWGKVGFLWLFPGLCQQREFDFIFFPWLHVQLWQQPGQDRINVWGSSFLKGWSIPSLKTLDFASAPNSAACSTGSSSRTLCCVGEASKSPGNLPWPTDKAEKSFTRALMLSVSGINLK